MNTYLFVLGRNPEISRSELRFFGKEILYDEEKSLLLATDLQMENPREIPRDPHQLFLDRLGGTIRIAQVLGEYRDLSPLKEKIIENTQAQKPEGKIHLGISVFGGGRDFLKPFLPEIKNLFRDQNRNCRIINLPGKNLDSGKIFGEKLLKKGFEYILWKKNDSYLLAQTVANQNLRNYTLRDRSKNFRDAKMGMLPPKLAQILINLPGPSWEKTIIDPFCGSGTINIESAIMGYETVGSDREKNHVLQSQANFEQMAEKFRYEKNSGTFFPHDALTFPYEKYPSGVIITEGTLGENFEKRPSLSQIEKQSPEILTLWTKIFEKLEKSSIQDLVFCLPFWKNRYENVSLSDRLFQKLASQKSSYHPQTFSNGEKTLLYARPDAYVGREIIWTKRLGK